MLHLRTPFLLFLLALTACGGGGGGGGGDSQAFGLDARAAPSSVQIPTGAGGSGPLAVANAFPSLQFNGPVVLTHAGDGSNRLFVAERGGAIMVFANSRDTPQATTVLDLSASVDTDGGEAGFLGLAFDPGFSSNRNFYVSYVVKGTVPRKVRLARYRISSTNPSAVEANSERVLLEIDHANPYHFGGWIGFGPDGMLYMTHGDGGNDDQVQSTTALFGKVLRMRLNSDASAYLIPPDNPYGNLVWARGLRNPWRCSFDRAGNGNLWCGDVGNSRREEVNLIRRDANYGWPIYEGSLAYVNPDNRPYSDFAPPVYEYDHAGRVAVIGGYVYRGSALPAAFVGRYLYGDYTAQTVWALQFNGSGGVTANDTVAAGPPFLLGMGEDQNGELYLLSGSGVILGLQAAAGSSTGTAMPATLSATGLFSDLAQLTPSPGVIDYAVNAPFWSDGARKQRWFVLPAGATIGFAADGAWTFPVGTITVKHFELPLAAGGTTRVETRVMVYRTDGWTGYTYRWRADQSDADLLTSGGSATYQTINPATNAPTTLTWNFPSQAQCLNCHTQATGRALGLNTRQFNGNHTYAATGRGDNQLRALNHIGIFSSDIGAASQYSAMPNPADAAASLESRAKAHLDTNCSICHRPGGPTPVDMDLRYTTAPADMRLIGVANQGSVGGVRVVAGNHAGSLLWQRPASTDSNVRMPPLGVSMVDEAGLQLLASWIDALR